MICRNCNAINSSKVRFCRCCGNKIVKRQFKACTNWQCLNFRKYILPSEAKYCPICGHAINDKKSVDEQVASNLLAIIGGLQQYKKKCKEIPRHKGKYQFVDIGLTHKWATCNLGANSFSGRDRGLYYAWGETEPKSKYSRDNYKHIRKKRFFRADEYETLGNCISGTCYDPVSVFFSNSKIHLPTMSDWLELIEDCRWFNCLGNYYRVVGPNGNHIILPYYDGVCTEELGLGKVSCAYLCGNAPDESYKKNSLLVLLLSDTEFRLAYVGGRYLGRMVRPVCDM